MQISNPKVFVFVEGQDSDPYFYDRVSDSVCSAPHIAYRIVRAEQIGRGAGKNALLQFFYYLRTVNSLFDNFTGKRTISIFYLDKDLDDINRKKVFSDHVVYTEPYCVENYLFAHGDLINAACAAASLEREILEQSIGSPADWTQRMAGLWKEWLTLCLFASRHSLNVQSNYSRNESAINVPPNGPVSQRLLIERKADLEVAFGKSSAEFNGAFRCVERTVDRLYRVGKHDVIFKGKWYRRLLQLQIEQAAATQTFNAHALANSIVSALRQSLDFEQSWSARLRTPLQRLVDQL
jgi:hypothetical protein